MPSYLPPIKTAEPSSSPPPLPCTNLRGLADQFRAGRELLLSLKGILRVRETRQEEYTANFSFSQHTIHLDAKGSEPSQKGILPRFCHHIAKQILCVYSASWLEIISLYSRFKVLIQKIVSVPRENEKISSQLELCSFLDLPGYFQIQSDMSQHWDTVKGTRTCPTSKAIFDLQGRT